MKKVDPTYFLTQRSKSKLEVYPNIILLLLISIMHMVTNYDFETPDDPPGISQDGDNHVGKTQHEKLQNKSE